MNVFLKYKNQCIKKQNYPRNERLFLYQIVQSCNLQISRLQELNLHNHHARRVIRHSFIEKQTNKKLLNWELKDRSLNFFSYNPSHPQYALLYPFCQINFSLWNL